MIPGSGRSLRERNGPLYIPIHMNRCDFWTNMDPYFKLLSGLYLDWFFFNSFSKSFFSPPDIMLGTGGTGMNQTTLLLS